MSNIKDLRLAQYILCEALTKTELGQLRASVWDAVIRLKT